MGSITITNNNNNNSGGARYHNSNNNHIIRIRISLNCSADALRIII